MEPVLTLFEMPERRKPWEGRYLGDTLYAKKWGFLGVLPGNTSTTLKVLTREGDGTNSAAPEWQTLSGVGDPVLTGDVTSPGDGVTTVVNLPDGVTQAGKLVVTEIAEPATPAAGQINIYADSTSLNFAAKNESGAVNHGVQTQAGATHKWIKSIADDGSSVIAQPDYSDLSGTPPAPSLTKSQVVSDNSHSSYSLTGSLAAVTTGITPTLNTPGAGTFIFGCQIELTGLTAGDMVLIQIYQASDGGVLLAQQNYTFDSYSGSQFVQLHSTLYTVTGVKTVTIYAQNRGGVRGSIAAATLWYIQIDP